MRSRLERQFGERAGDRRQHQQHRVDGVEQRALVVLQILVVAAGQSLERRQQRWRGRRACARRDPRASSSASGFRFCGIMLDPVRERVAELHEAEFARAEEDQVLGEAREVRADHRDGEQHLGDEVAIADGIDGVRRDRRRSRGCPAAARARPGRRSRRPRREPSGRHGGRALRRARVARDRARAARSATASSAPPSTGLRALQVRVRRHESRLRAVRPGASITCCSSRTAASSAAHASIVQRRVAVAT